MTHASDGWPSAILVAIWALTIIFAIMSSQRGRQFFIRRIPGLNAIDEALGRATEMGRPIILCPGQNDVKDSISPIQALAIFSYIIKSAAKFGNKVFLPCSAPGVYTIAQEVVQDSYAAAGKPELYDPDIVQFISDRQFAYAAGVAGMIQREKVAANFMFGDFYAESLILADSGQAVGAIQVAATIQTTQIPFFIAACDYTLIGDEFYAATAYISREPTLLGSLVGQDIGKLSMLIMVVIGSVCMSIWGPDAAFVKWFTN
jgi:hypothetical protein